MIALSHHGETAAPRPLGAAITAALIVVIPIALALICFAARLAHHRAVARPCAPSCSSRCCSALMLTGMPISISLGLTVLTSCSP